MSFEKDKENAMKKLSEALEKGEVDKDIVKFLERINKQRWMYTTSSCSGRFQIICFYFDKNGELNFERRFVEHNPEKEIKLPKEWKGYLMLLVEPPILHLVVKDLENASKLLYIAREAGFKRSGIRSMKEERIVIEILSTEFLKMPIGKDGKLCKECYDLGLEIGRKLLKRAKEKLKKLEELIERETHMI